MRERFSCWYRSARRRLQEFERREIRAIRHWLADAENLLHLSALVFVPLLVGGVTWLANVSPVVSFLVYPPLAAGAVLAPSVVPLETQPVVFAVFAGLAVGYYVLVRGSRLDPYAT